MRSFLIVWRIRNEADGGCIKGAVPGRIRSESSVHLNNSPLSWSLHHSNFNFSGGCFGTEIIQKSKMHEMAKYRSSRADIWTNLRQFSIRFFFNSKKWETMTIWPKTKQNKSFVVKKNFEKLHASHQSWKNKCPDIIYSNWINLIIYNQFKLKSIQHHICLRKSA